MDPITALALANAGLALMEQLIPQIQEAAHRGDITVEQQAEVRRRYLSLKARAEGQFAGPEWSLSTQA